MNLFLSLIHWLHIFHSYLLMIITPLSSLSIKMNLKEIILTLIFLSHVIITAPFLTKNCLVCSYLVRQKPPDQMVYPLYCSKNYLLMPFKSYLIFIILYGFQVSSLKFGVRL
uniref:Uncharacterized protein n=1 Tax=Cacopsylla melanoneura TaxID=428564 RepID=A0A8D8TJ21_9HEMI